MICFVLEMTIKISVLKLNQSAYSPMENNASTHAILTASTRHVTESTVVVSLAVFFIKYKTFYFKKSFHDIECT